ncbi:MAG: VCBS repeat-containing protein [Pseudohongiellaceae bacterium]|nr:VCBS repeat-containing protein [Pseudohongiellaceae bacterium]
MTYFKRYLSPICLYALPALAHAQAGLPDYDAIEFTLTADTQQIVSVDLDNDALVDVIGITKEQMDVYFQREADGTRAAFDFAKADVSIPLQGQNIAWQVSGNYSTQSASQSLSILLFIDGQRIVEQSFDGQTLAQARVLLDGLNGFVGAGINQQRFSQDINLDGLDDLIVPSAGSLELHIRNEDGSYQVPLVIMSDMRITTRLSLQQTLERDVGQSVVIPQIELRDVNNDGSEDIISRTEERFDVFLAQAQSQRYFNPTPSYSLDLLAIQERLGEFDVDQIDFANLTGMLSLTHEEILDDVNGDGIDDFVLREGSKVSLFKGLSNGMDLSQPVQILRSGGNVLSSFLYDENEDGRKDLWLWRIEPISVGDIFLWLAISGSIDVEAFVYPNEGERFARRPTRQVTVTLKFPSVVRAINTVMEFRDQREAASENASTPNTVASLDDEIENDFIVLLEDRIQVFLDAIEPPTQASEDRFLASLNYSRNRDNYEIDLQELIENVEIEDQYGLNDLADKAKDFELTMPSTMRNGDISALQLNKDQRNDIFVFLERSNDEIKGVLLLSR